MSTSTLVTRSAEETRELGCRLGELAQPGDVLLLVGDLGSGKTCLTQGIARGLGITAPVNSPTFVLVNEHQGRLRLYHADLYRIDSDLEAIDLGIEEDMMGQGVTVVEWAERAPSLWPPEALVVRLDWVDSATRRLTLEPRGGSWGPRLAKLIERGVPSGRKAS